jgi:transcriptional regulator with XRE-family HTH domain
METRQAFAESLRQIRTARELTQEDFDAVSSRTYVSLLERAEKSPTLDKIESLSRAMNVHPLTLLTLTFMKRGASKHVEDIQRIVRSELASLLKRSP